MLQIEILNPRYILVDEIDSGLDIDAFKAVASSLAAYSTTERALIVVTHNYRLAEYLLPDQVVVIDAGKIAEIGSIALLREVEKIGFSAPTSVHSSI